MTTDLQAKPSSPRWLKALAVSLTVAMAVILLANAATTTIWEDESNGFFLSKRPLGEMLGLMASNVHEDPPLFDVLLNGWIHVAGHNLLLLRAMSIGFWLLMLPGLFLSARRLAGQRAAWTAIVVVGLMPAAWLFPASMRWYSLFACLSVWNFHALLRIAGIGDDGNRATACSDRRLVRTMPYWLTGAALWYTNYSAPVVFFSHLLVALFRRGPKRRLLVDLVVGWLMIGILYIPWLPTFFRQLGASSHPFSPTLTAVTGWSILAGEFSTPLSLGIAAAVAALAVTLTILTIVRFRECWIPVTVIAVVFATMSLTGVIWTKRVVFLVPFVAMTLSLAISRSGSASRWLQAGKACLVGLLVVVSALSFAQMIRRDQWLSYRWLDPCQEAVARVQEVAPDAILLTNSNPVLYYLGDPYGKSVRDLAAVDPQTFCPKAVVYPFDDATIARYRPMLRDARRAAYIYHSAYTGPISNGYEQLVEQMQAYGFQPATMEGLMEMPAEFAKRHPRYKDSKLGTVDDERIVIVYFDKPHVLSPDASALSAAGH